MRLGEARRIVIKIGSALVVEPKTATPRSEWMEGVYIKVHYQNEMPNGCKFELGVNFTPEIWYDDAMVSVNWT
jgi:hypothetical protein